MEFTEYLRNLDPKQVVGVLGFLTYLTAFGAVQSGRMDGNGLAFTLCNMTAAVLVGISLFEEFNLSAALIQASYFIIGTIGVLRWMFRRATAGKAMFEGDMS